MQTLFGEEQNLFYMREALHEAQLAYEQDEVPVGAIIVDQNGTIVTRAHNQVESQHTQIAHAEMQALINACKQLGDWRLNDYSVYVTLQPCAMCMHAIKLHRVKGLVYGADSPLFGYHLDKIKFDSVYKNDTIQILSGVEREKSEQLLKNFFKMKRKQSWPMM